MPQEKLQDVRAGPNTSHLTKKPRLDTKATTYTQATVTKNKAKMRPKGSTNLDTTPAPGPSRRTPPDPSNYVKVAENPSDYMKALLAQAIT